MKARFFLEIELYTPIYCSSQKIEQSRMLITKIIAICENFGARCWQHRLLSRLTSWWAGHSDDDTVSLVAIMFAISHYAATYEMSQIVSFLMCVHNPVRNNPAYFMYR